MILQDPEYREIRRAARSRHMSLAEWVRQALELARRRESLGSVAKKLEIIQAAARHSFPVGETAQALKRGLISNCLRGAGSAALPRSRMISQFFRSLRGP